jgi:DNA-binding response OmpR family regulator
VDVPVEYVMPCVGIDLHELLDEEGVDGQLLREMLLLIHLKTTALQEVAMREGESALTLVARKLDELLVKRGSIVIGEFTIDLDAATCLRNGDAIPLNKKRFALLAALAERRGTPVTRAELMTIAWGYADKALYVRLALHIKSLREALWPEGQQETGPAIRSVTGVGYVFSLE